MKHLPLILLVVITVTAFGQSFTPAISKLHARNPSINNLQHFGSGVALSDLYALVGEAQDGAGQDTRGAVHVFGGKTGLYQRTLRALVPTSGDQFGRSVALHGTVALVGANGYLSGRGAAYLFNLTTGKQTRILTASDGVAGDDFGISVALTGRFALVGARKQNNERGAVYVFDINTGTQVRKLTASDASDGDAFGSSVTASGDIALVGSPLKDNGSIYFFHLPTGAEINKLLASDGTAGDAFGTSVALGGWQALVGAPKDDSVRGSAYLFDIANQTELGKLTAPDGDVGDGFGGSVSLSGNLALIGASGDGSSRGSAYLFNATTRTLITKLTAPDGGAGKGYGHRVIIQGNQALISSPFDSDQGFEAGSAYLYRNLAGPLSMSTLASKGDFAPGLVEASYSALGDAFLNEDSEAVFLATLTGSGAPKGKTSAVFQTLGGVPALTAQSGATVLATDITGSSFLSPSLNRLDQGIFQAVLKGTGVTTNNNQAVFSYTATGAPTLMFRTGVPIAGLGGALLKSWTDLCSDQEPGAGLAAVSFLLKTGTAGVDASNDTGILRIYGSSTEDTYREGRNGVEDRRSGSTVVVTDALGQFLPRLAMQGNSIVHFTAAIQSSPTTNQGLFRAFGAPELIARKGETAQNTGGALFSSFVTETSRDDPSLFRAILSGTGVTVANNEALFCLISGNNYPQAFARKGQEPDPVNEPGIRFSRFLQFWPSPSNRALFWVTLSGPGVTAANDGALYLCTGGTGTFIRLLREGDPTPLADGARIGAIQRIHASRLTLGAYAVLTSLTGSTAGNLALWTGRATEGDEADVRRYRRLPTLQLRKGTAYQRPTGQTTAIKSFTFPNTADAGGAGGKGRGQVITGPGIMTLNLEYTNGGKEILIGKP
jgi:hypothetical protein